MSVKVFPSIIISGHFCSIFKENPSQQQLSCRTEKDRGVRLNHRTAGINNASGCDRNYLSHPKPLMHMYADVFSCILVALYYILHAWVAILGSILEYCTWCDKEKRFNLDLWLYISKSPSYLCKQAYKHM